jgi:23S rRNA (adenine2503-C2)-methyltransferase
MEKENLLGYSVPQMERLLESMGEKAYKGRQLFKWLYSSRQYDFALMTDLRKDLRQQLADRYTFAMRPPVRTARSSDGTEKFLFRLDDSHSIETVLIADPGRDRRTVCISTQAGCALGCVFCATGAIGFGRNLTVGEIVGQLVYLRELYGQACFSHVVFMGMGEPLANYENLITAVGIMTHPAGLAISARRITISTVGLPSQIRKLADSRLKTRLAVSLHAAIEEKRRQLLPIAAKHSLTDLMAAVKYFTFRTGGRVTFEYILFDGFNDATEDVLALAELIRGIPCKINVLAYNPVDGVDLKRPTDDKVDWFGRQLYPRAPAVTVRKSKGLDIGAACGQLAGRED